MKIVHTSAIFARDPRPRESPRPNRVVQRTLDTVHVALDAQRRVKRVIWFFYGLAALALLGGFVIDAQPPRPRLDCHQSLGQMYSHYPHP